jgi:hypothetical protein
MKNTLTLKSKIINLFTKTTPNTTKEETPANRPLALANKFTNNDMKNYLCSNDKKPVKKIEKEEFDYASVISENDDPLSLSGDQTDEDFFDE